MDYNKFQNNKLIDRILLIYLAIFFIYFATGIIYRVLIFKHL